MKKRVMKKWVKALRSGQYEQGQYQLVELGKSYDKFCCLGVLIDIYMQEVGDLEVEVHNPSKSAFYINDESKNPPKILIYDDESSLLPSAVKRWAGIATESGHITSSKYEDLVDLNDERGYSFKKIAEIIEKYYEAL